MNSRLFLTAALGAAMLAAPALPALADHHGGHHGTPGHGMMLQGLMKKLDLTADQKQKVQAIHARAKAAAQPLRAQMKTRHQELFQLLKSPTATADQIRAKHRELSALRTQLADIRLSALLEGRALLTPEQLKKLSEIKPGKRK